MRRILLIFVSLLTCRVVELNAAVTFVNKGCTGDYGNYTEGSSYQKNLNLLLNRLPAQATLVKFFNSTAGEGPDKVCGIFQCREDLSIEVCSKCVVDAAESIIQKCPYNGEAVIWYDECMLRYANRPIFSLYEVLPSAKRWSTTNFSNFVEFSSVFAETMSGLISEVVLSMPSRYYATKEATVTEYDRLYCLVQCTPDLDGFGCKNCLKAAVIAINNCCRGSIRATSFLPSCQVKYDMSPFYNQTENQLILVPTPSSPASIHSANRLNSSVIVGIAVATSVGLGLLLLIGIWLCLLHKKAAKTSCMHEVEDTLREDTSLGNEELVRYDFASLRNATEGFSVHKKLGEGGFGVVYKGLLESGEEIAIKRLSGNSAQGAQEFMTEASIVAKLQHRNLVKLMGFCSEGEEKLLVYEFMPNTSLDHFLFNPRNQALLPWETRHKIIMGITRGMQYLHEDSSHTVVHRDLKASNILLDGEMNPKIADFGLAKLCGEDNKFGNTSRIAGTHGYMAPEYVSTGEYSNKSDVYSFGVILLEIVSGRKNKNTSQSPHHENLLINALRLWNEGQSLDLIDPTLHDNYSRSEVMRCIRIGILCVQEDAAKRPTMASVALMLTGSIEITLPSTPVISSFNIEIPTDHANDDQVNDVTSQLTNSTNSQTEVEQDLYPR